MRGSWETIREICFIGDIYEQGELFGHTHIHNSTIRTITYHKWCFYIFQFRKHIITSEWCSLNGLYVEKKSRSISRIKLLSRSPLIAFWHEQCAIFWQHFWSSLLVSLSKLSSVSLPFCSKVHIFLQSNLECNVLTCTSTSFAFSILSSLQYKSSSTK